MNALTGVALGIAATDQLACARIAQGAALPDWAGTGMVARHLFRVRADRAGAIAHVLSDAASLLPPPPFCLPPLWWLSDEAQALLAVFQSMREIGLSQPGGEMLLVVLRLLEDRMASSRGGAGESGEIVLLDGQLVVSPPGLFETGPYPGVIELWSADHAERFDLQSKEAMNRLGSLSEARAREVLVALLAELSTLALGL